MVEGKAVGLHTETFYKDNEVKLLDCYPGLTLRRLKQELESFCIQHQLNVDNLFDTLYIPSLNNPLTFFFDKLSQGWPLEYIRGKAYFYRSEFSVDKNVLIPRSETEILVEMACEELKEWSKKTDERLQLLDIGTGSGAIILSILQELDRSLSAHATDLSKDALKVARRNYFNLRFSIPKESSLRLYHTDRMNDLNEKYHLVVSNPPYIKEDKDRSNVHHQVDHFEPHMALYLSDDIYTQWFSKLFTDVYNSLYEEGIFIMEGHEDHLKELGDLAKNIGFKEVSIIPDFTGRDRFIRMRK